MFSFIPKALGIILNFIYENLSFKNYGLAIILFTIFVKLILLPLTIKQSKSTAKMQELQPIIQDLQRKYKNEPNKLNEELVKLYAEHKYNPASGCLPLLIQLPIIFSLIYVIGQPLTYMFNYSLEEINSLLSTVPKEMAISGFYAQLGAVNYHNILNMKFLGLDLGLVPTWRPNILFGPEMAKYLPLLILPILSVSSTVLSNKLIMMSNMKKEGNGTKKDNSQDPNVAMQRNMSIIAPLMTLWVSFQFPAGLGLYWFTSNVFQILQQLYINKYIVNKKEVKES
mgnify:CR=1 FL=1